MTYGGITAWTDSGGSGTAVATSNGTALGTYKYTDGDGDGTATALHGSVSTGISVPIAESDVTSLVADLALKAPLASPTFTGTPVAPTAAQNTNTTQIATTAMVHSEAVLLAPKASPTLTGTITVPNGSGATDAAAFGQIPTAGGVGGYSKVVTRTSNSGTVSSNNTPGADDTLKWAVGASDRWFFQAMLTFTAADAAGLATTADVQVGWTVPASGTMQWGAFGSLGSNFAGYGATAQAASPLAILTAASVLAAGGAALSFGMALSGFYTGGGSAGTVNLTWAQNTSNAATLVLLQNSSLILWRLS